MHQVINSDRLINVLSVMVKEWPELNSATRLSWFAEAVQGLQSKGTYVLPNDVTITGKRFFIEPMSVVDL